MSLNLYQKFLYREVFCSYREKKENEIKCTHPYGFGKCNLDLGPIVQDQFANVVFKPEGIKLVIKEPTEGRMGGIWKEEELDIKVDEENNRNEIIEKIKGQTEGITEENKKALIQRINDIFQHYEFLIEKNNPPGILGGKPEEEAAEEEDLFEEEEEFFEKEREELFKEEAEEREKEASEELTDEDLFESEEEISEEENEEENTLEN